MIYIICLIVLPILVIFGYKKIIEHISNKHMEKVKKYIKTNDINISD